MKRSLFLVSIAAAALLLPQPALANCTDQDPQIGTLEVKGPVRLTAARRGVERLVANGDKICLGDDLLPSPVGGAVKLIDGKRIAFIANASPKLPPRKLSKIEWLTAQLLTGKYWLGAGSMGEDASGFALTSLVSGKARIGRGYRQIVIPVTPLKSNETITLYRTGTARAIFRSQLKAGDWLATFDATKLRPAQYEIAIGDSPFRARFTVEDVQLDPEIAKAGLKGASAILGHACVDPERNTLDAFQRLSQIGAEKRYFDALLRWQQPTELLSCGTP